MKLKMDMYIIYFWDWKGELDLYAAFGLDDLSEWIKRLQNRGLKIASIHDAFERGL